LKGPNPAAEVLTLGAAVYAVWLLLSGHYTVFLLTIGFVCTLLVVYVALRMRVVDHEGVPLTQLNFTMITYLPWLCVEVVKSNLAVARIVLSPRLPISPTLVRFRGMQRTDLGRFIFANSITLTPGTITLLVHQTQFEVHALYRGALDGIEEGEMNRRVAAMERQVPAS
jgi:multicomponent Na+:H+ antiporter subunit E